MLGNNIKIHFAGSDNVFSANAALKIAEVNYRLYTCYPFNRKSSVTFLFTIETGCAIA